MATNHGLRRAVGVALLAALAGQAGVALAADSELEELVVTAPHYVPTTNSAATKLDVPLIETPQSISVVTRDQVDLLNMQNLSQAVRYSSGIIGENFGSDERVDWLTLRGFNPVQYIDGLQAPVGSVSNVGVDLYGFDSVEILKGPSSVLYGLAPPGGIVNLTSRRPLDELQGEVQLLAGRYSNEQVAADLTGPLNQYFSARITGLYYDRGTQTDKVNSRRSYVAPALTVHVTPDTRLTLLSYFQSDRIQGDGGGFLPAQGTVLPHPSGRLHANTNAGEPNYNRYDRDQYGVGYDFEHTFSDMWSLQQNLKYFHQDAEMRSVYGAGLQVDENGNPTEILNRYNFPFNEIISTFDVDTRVKARFQTGPLAHILLMGVDWRRYVNQAEFAFGFGPSINIFHPVYGATPIVTPSPYFQYTDQVQKQLGFYVQDQIKAGRWVFTLSGRQDNVEATNFGAKSKDDKFTYRGGVNYLFDSGIAPYVSYATSFQPTYGATFTGKAFVPTTGDQVEAGVKVEPRNLPDGVHALVTLAAYNLKQKNVLVPDPDQINHPFGQVQAGEVKVKGIELEGIARFYERFSINGSYSYTDSNAGGGNELVMVPQNKLSLLADYTFQTGLLAGFGANAGLRYLSSYYGDPANQWKTDSVTLGDLGLHYDRAKWHAAVNVSNVTDKEYLSRCTSTSQCFFGLRRNITFSVSRSFGDRTL